MIRSGPRQVKREEKQLQRDPVRVIKTETEATPVLLQERREGTETTKGLQGETEEVVLDPPIAPRLMIRMRSVTEEEVASMTEETPTVRMTTETMNSKERTGKFRPI